MEIRAFFEMKTSFFLFSPQISSNFAKNTFVFLVHTLELKELKFLCARKICLCLPPPPPSHAFLRRAYLHHGKLPSDSIQDPQRNCPSSSNSSNWSFSILLVKLVWKSFLRHSAYMAKPSKLRPFNSEK